MATKNKNEKLDFLHNIKKEIDIHSLLAEVLPKLEFKDVAITHERGNMPENGKDLVCSLYDKLEDKKDWYAFVVKKGTINGTSSQINEIESQIKDCFKYEYKSLKTTSERVRINKVKVVTNEHFSSGAKEKILSNQDIDKANVDFWDDEKLIALIDKNYPQYWQNGSPTYKEYVEKFLASIDRDDFSKRLGLSDAKIKKLINLFVEPVLLEKEEDSSGQIVYRQRKTNAILQSDKSIFIIGESGCGKSTLFRQLSKQIIEQNSLRNNYELYPIILSFNQIKQNNFSIEKTIKKYFSNDIYRDLEIDIDFILHENKCIIFIDALDEIASNSEKESAFDSVQSFAKQCPYIKLICTSRPSDFLYQCCADKGFRSFEIDRIDRRQMSQYIQAYFSDNELLSKRLIKSLQDSGLLDKLPQTPMTLALITIIFDEKQMEIPSTITDLYSIFVDLLLKKFEFKSTIDIIETDIKHRLLANLAKEMHVKQTVSIDKKEVFRIISSYLQERGQYNINVEDLLEDIINNNALLIYNERAELQFKHLSFQEYFTAYEFYHHRQVERNIFIKGFNKLWWQNVAIFYAGFSKDAPMLLDEIIDIGKHTSGIIPQFNVMTGIGRLMQSLYSTPVKNRTEGVCLTAGLACNIVSELINTTDSRFVMFKNLSKYGIYQMLLAGFEISHHSITLQEPLKLAFERLTENINDSTIPRFELLYSMFVMAATMGNSSFLNFEPYKFLLENTTTDDLSLIALEEMWFRINYKELSKEQKGLDDIVWIKKKIQKQMQQLGAIAHLVNIPLNKEQKKIDLKSRREETSIEE